MGVFVSAFAKLVFVSSQLVLIKFCMSVLKSVGIGIQ